MWHHHQEQPLAFRAGVSGGLSHKHLNKQRPELGISVGIMRQYPVNAAQKPTVLDAFSVACPFLPI